MQDIRNYRPSISLNESESMAKVLDVPTSGSVGGVTHSHGRAGQYIRARRMPCQPVGSGRRGVIRAAFGAASGAWAGLTQTVQAAWTSYADSHPYSDSLGQSIKLTGHQMFVAINTMLLNCGAAVSSTIPVTDATFAAGFSAFTAVHAGAITLTPSGLGLVTGRSLGLTLLKIFKAGIGIPELGSQMTMPILNALTELYRMSF